MNIAPHSPDPHRRRNPLAGGIFIAILPIAGAWIGGRQGEPVIGLLAGLGAGMIAALAVWTLDRITGGAR